MARSFLYAFGSTRRWGVLAALLSCGFACSAHRTPFEVGDAPDNSVLVPEPFRGIPSPPPGGDVPSIFQPEFGRTTIRANAPPPLGGASLIITRDGTTAVASDPDRARVLVIDLPTHAVRSVALEPGDEPSRLVEDGHHYVHVVLRRGGAVASFSLGDASFPLARRKTCASPQGIAVEQDTLFVACADGQLMTLPSSVEGTPAKTIATLDRDLRDVVIVSDGLMVSRLRSAEVIHVAGDGTVIDRLRPPARASGKDEPFVGWRLVALPTAEPGRPAAGAVLVHQVARSGPVDVSSPNAYSSGGDCTGLVNTALTTFTLRETPSAVGPQPSTMLAIPGPLVHNAAVPVDLARSRDGIVAIVAAGNAHTSALAQVNVVPRSDPGPSPCSRQSDAHDPPGQAAATAFAPDGKTLVVFTREPAAVHLRDVGQPGPRPWTTIALGGESVVDTGQAIFHANAGGGIACVSCHPEGGDDGRVWNLSTGARRTQTLRGTIAGTAPYHWGGDAPDMFTFAGDVFRGRMAGPALKDDQVGALRAWLERIPAPPAETPRSIESVARGKSLFESQNVGCASCHSGASFTNNDSVDVGTGGSFQVPSLVGVVHRAPYFHDGCATDLHARFTNACAGGDAHGNTSRLSNTDVDDLVAYLSTL